jgi:hypothetical protein
VFCRNEGGLPRDVAAGWHYLLEVPVGGVAVEIAPGLARDTPGLGAPGRTSVAMVPTLANGGIVERRLHEHGKGNWAVVVPPGLERLPLADGSVSALVMDGVEGAGFDLHPGNVTAVVGEWRRVLAPEGTLLMGLRNPLHDLPLIGALRRKAVKTVRRESADRCVRRKARVSAGAALSPSAMRRAMRAGGFDEPRVFAPFPDGDRVQVVLPADDARTTRYFLTRLVRSESATVRLALAAGRALAAMGLFGKVFPSYHYLVYGGRPGGR